MQQQENAGEASQVSTQAGTASEDVFKKTAEEASSSDESSDARINEQQEQEEVSPQSKPMPKSTPDVTNNEPLVPDKKDAEGVDMQQQENAGEAKQAHQQAKVGVTSVTSKQSSAETDTASVDSDQHLDPSFPPGSPCQKWLVDAQKGNPQAQYNLGYSYYYGKNGSIEDKSIAIDWYEKSAQQGNPKALNALGYHNQMQQNYKRAIELYRQAYESETANLKTKEEAREHVESLCRRFSHLCNQPQRGQ
jgi:tetratricopeptide (TPR) repeat protein